MPSFANLLIIWNRRLHYYLGLYFLLFLWLFALTGLLLNHSTWAFQQFFPNRHVTKFERSVQLLPASASETERARSIMRQLGIEGEIAWGAPQSDPARFDFNVSRPGRIWQIQTDLAHARAAITFTDYNVWGVVRTLHTFTGVNPDDHRNQRDWLLTTVWAFAMDALAFGVILMVLTSLYMWWRLKEKRIFGIVSLALGLVVCGLFVSGLRWIYPAH